MPCFETLLDFINDFILILYIYLCLSEHLLTLISLFYHIQLVIDLHQFRVEFAFGCQQTVHLCGDLLQLVLAVLEVRVKAPDFLLQSCDL